MLEPLKYQNHVGEVIDFGSDGVFVNASELHNYEWKVATIGNRISGFNRGIQTRALPIVIMCDTEEEGIEKRNNLYETFDKDVLSAQHGKVIIGDYYFRCYVTKSTKSDYQKSKQYMSLKLTLSTDFPYWVKETTITNRSNLSGSFVAVNNNFVASNFRLVIYGEATNPEIEIDGHSYMVNCKVGTNEYLTIDSTTKQIYTTKKDGTIINNFNDRGRSSYIFEKIPPGTIEVASPGDFAFDIVLLDERSEPTWT